jgi:hypothetical protein
MPENSDDLRKGCSVARLHYRLRFTHMPAGGKSSRIQSVSRAMHRWPAGGKDARRGYVSGVADRTPAVQSVT